MRGPPNCDHLTMALWTLDIARNSGKWHWISSTVWGPPNCDHPTQNCRQTRACKWTRDVHWFILNVTRVTTQPDQWNVPPHPTHQWGDAKDATTTTRVSLRDAQKRRNSSGTGWKGAVSCQVFFFKIFKIAPTPAHLWMAK